MLKKILSIIFSLFKRKKETFLIKDYRDKLPKHATRKWLKRNLENIKWIVIHQTIGKATIEQIAQYHITASENNHISKKGTPKICYHFAIRRNGEILYTNDEIYRVWACGHHNTWSINILVNGNFDGPTYEGSEEPSKNQIKSLKFLLNDIKKRYPQAEILGHGDLVKYKVNCPGNTLTEELNKFRN